MQDNVVLDIDRWFAYRSEGSYVCFASFWSRRALHDFVNLFVTQNLTADGYQCPMSISIL